MFAETLAQILGAQPVILILDPRLPDEDGFAVCEALKADPATRALPILVLSGLISPEDKVRALKLGADDYLTKPFHVQELTARIAALLRRTGHGARSTEHGAEREGLQAGRGADRPDTARAAQQAESRQQ